MVKTKTLDEYKKEIKINPVGGGPCPTEYIAGYFCQGPESLPLDGLTCYINVHGKPEKIREQHLSPRCKTKDEAVKKSYELYKKEVR